jgi:hypothetical protein
MSETHSYGKGVSGFDQIFGAPMRQFVPTLIRMARISPGQKVLDIATGTGNAAEEAVRAVGLSGHVPRQRTTRPPCWNRRAGALKGCRMPPSRSTPNTASISR